MIVSVHELMAEGARSLPEPFTREAVIEWFRSHYPDVKTGTVSTHIAGLTVGRNPDSFPFLAHRARVFERVGRGLYQRAGSTSALAADAGSATPPGIGIDVMGAARAKQATAQAEFPADGFRGVAPAKA